MPNADLDTLLRDGGRPTGTSMPETDAEFWYRILDAADWLFYGDLEEHFGAFVFDIFASLEETTPGVLSFGRFGFPSGLPLQPYFSVAYWLFLSELIALNLAEYGTSPRGAWLTETGMRFRRIFLEHYENDTLNWRPDPYAA